MKYLLLIITIYSSLQLQACSSFKENLSPVKEKTPVLARGWSFIENSGEKELDAGVQPLTYANPVIEGDKIIFGSERFGLRVLHKDTGQVLWKKNIPDGINSQPLIAQNRVYVGSEDGVLRCVDLQSGNELWQKNLGMSIHGAPILASDRLVVGTIDENIHAIDPTSGKILWTYKRPLTTGTSIRGGGNPSYINGSIWVGFSDGSLVVLEINDGSVKEEKQFRDNVKFPDINAKVIAWKEGVLVPTYDGKLRYLKKDLSLIWEFPAGGARAVLPSTINGNLLFFPSSEGTVYAIAGDTGKEVWRFSMPYGSPTGIALMGNGETSTATLVVASSEHKIFALDAYTGKELGKSSLGRGSGSFSSLAIDQEKKNVYVLSLFSRLHQFKVTR